MDNKRKGEKRIGWGKAENVAEAMGRRKKFEYVSGPAIQRVSIKY